MRRTLAFLCASLLALGAARAQVPEPPPAQAGLGLLDAVGSTLALLPDIQLAQQEVALSRGALLVALGRFDYTLRATLSQAGATTPYSPDTVQYNQYLLDTYKSDGLISGTTPTAGSSSTTYTTAWSLGLSRQFRSGLTITPSVSLSYQNPRSLDYTYPSLTTVPTPTGTATVNFRLVQPLLRGRGAEATAAEETAARSDVEAAELQLRDTVARKIVEVTLAYWSYAAAHQAIVTRGQAEERAARVLAHEEELVRSGEHPAAELHKLRANQSEARTARLNAVRAFIEARQALGLAMGLPWRDIPALAPPADVLTTLAAPALPDRDEIDALVERAWRLRPDRLALLATVRSAEVLTRGARRGLDAQLDLELDLGYTGLTESSGAAPLITPLGDSVRGVNFTGLLSFAYPVRNHAARGLLTQREAAQRRAAIQLRDRERRIGASVALAVADLGNDLQALESAEAAAAAYRTAALNEEKRLKAGLATIFDLLITQERLTSAELSALELRGAVAAAVVRLRYETGTLLDASAAQHHLTLEQLTTLPARP